jgi:transposase
MRYTNDERLAIGEEIATGKITTREAVLKYEIGLSTAQLYAQQYREKHDIPSPIGIKHSVQKSKKSLDLDIEAYQAMSKEELINELILAKVNEARAKKGYEVKGVGADKEFVSLNNKNSKS